MKKKEIDITQDFIKSSQVPQRLWKYEDMMTKKSCSKKRKGKIIK